MFVFLILFWDVWKFGDAGKESNKKRQLDPPNPVVLLNDWMISSGKQGSDGQLSVAGYKCLTS